MLALDYRRHLLDRKRIVFNRQRRLDCPDAVLLSEPRTGAQMTMPFDASNLLRDIGNEADDFIGQGKRG